MRVVDGVLVKSRPKAWLYVDVVRDLYCEDRAIRESLENDYIAAGYDPPPAIERAEQCQAGELYEPRAPDGGGFANDEFAMTYQEIGDELGISKDRVAQILAKIFRKLRREAASCPRSRIRACAELAEFDWGRREYLLWLNRQTTHVYMQDTSGCFVDISID